MLSLKILQRLNVRQLFSISHKPQRRSIFYFRILEWFKSFSKIIKSKAIIHLLFQNLFSYESKIWNCRVQFQTSNQEMKHILYSIFDLKIEHFLFAWICFTETNTCLFLDPFRDQRKQLKLLILKRNTRFISLNDLILLIFL